MNTFTDGMINGNYMTKEMEKYLRENKVYDMYVSKKKELLSVGVADDVAHFKALEGTFNSQEFKTNSAKIQDEAKVKVDENHFEKLTDEIVNSRKVIEWIYNNLK